MLMQNPDPNHLERGDSRAVGSTCIHGHLLCTHGRCSSRCHDCTDGFGPDWWLDEDAFDRWTDDGGLTPVDDRQAVKCVARETAAE